MENWWAFNQFQMGGYPAVLSWTFWVVFSIVMHELAHGWAAIWQGDNTPRILQRMTWNPLVHMPPMSFLMFAVIGIAWGLMPTDPSKYRWRRKGRIVVSGAGPAMNILLAFISMNCLVLWVNYSPGRVDSDIYINFAFFFSIGAMLNIVLAIFNLLPMPPLDGSSILAGISMKWYIWEKNPTFQQFGFFVLLVIFFSGAIQPLWDFASIIPYKYVFAVNPLLP